MRLLLARDFLKPRVPASFGPDKGINQGFTLSSPDTLTTSQTSTRQKTENKAGVTSQLRPDTVLAFLGKKMLSLNKVQEQREEKTAGEQEEV